nr:Rv2231c family pyridoxal phosphate-dependent protein CobC [Corynebacterium lactis]
MLNDPLRYHGDQAARGAHLDFAVNVHGDTPSWLKSAIAEAIDDLAAYPDEALTDLVRADIARLHGRSPEEVLLLHGVAEGFSLLPDLGLAATIIAPQFTEPEAAFRAAGVDVDSLVLPPPFRLPFALDDGHDADPADLASRLAGRMAIVGNPTNPTGVLHSAEDLARVARLAEVLVVDEAFMDVVDSASAARASLAEGGGSNVIIFRSMTKTWAIAGLRCGYALGSPELLRRLARRRPYWPLGTLQLRAMLAIARRGEDYLPAIRSEISSQRAGMEKALASAGWTVAPSQAPFLLARAPVGAGGLGVGKRGEGEHEAARLALSERGISVRRCDTFAGLDQTWWRLAVRDEAQVRQLIDAVRDVTEC